MLSTWLMNQTLFNKTTSHKKPKMVSRIGPYGTELRGMVESSGWESKGRCSNYDSFLISCVTLHRSFDLAEA